MELSNLKEIILVVVIIGIVLGIGIMILEEFKGSIEYNVASTTQTILSDNNSAQTLTATPTAGTFSATAINQTWLSFDGVNDYIRVDSPVIANNLSVCLWMNLTDLTVTSQILQIDLATDFGINFGDDTPKSLKVSYSGIGLGKNITIPLIQSSWTHVCGIANESLGTMNIYVNGEDVVDLTKGITEVPPGAVGKLQLGATADSMTGSLDEIRVYNKTLTLVEVLELNSSGRTPNSSLPTTGLILWLPLNENSGTTVHSFNQSDFGT